MLSLSALCLSLMAANTLSEAPRSADATVDRAPVSSTTSNPVSSSAGQPMVQAVQGVEIERRPFLMGTVARLVVGAESRERALEISGQVETLLREAEADLSTWQTETELARFNHSPVGQPVRLSSHLDRELERALECAHLTEGAFDPAMGALSQAWDLRGEGRIPQDDELRQALKNTGHPHLERGSSSDGQASWTRHREVIVDEGGFGKGAALDRVRLDLEQTIQDDGYVLVDLGGQILFHGTQEITDSWPVAVADPDDRHASVLMLSLPGGSVATSANSERAGHLIDPRTGRPADDFGSITVWTSSGLEADCLATGLFVAGPETALQLANAHDGVEVVVIERSSDNTLIARVSNGMRDRVEVISDRLSLLGDNTPKKTSDSHIQGSDSGDTFFDSSKVSGE